ncbi:hypothetical protein J3R30DRAFT_661077 [Lentinula aciculospora]|uniref:Uncharacterized protein n=1 Tax=Lentinula aciculospora TaxID=153920 RepID=A0A9W9DK50_9AGAR|nr:hypothetical protein J3R30DRAFT_661077 [Lentinula aciculospora]
MEARISDLTSFSSNISLSFCSSSSSSAYGQGSLSAKFIKAVGSLILRGSDWLIIQRRLSTIRTHVASQTSGQESVVVYGKYSLSPYPIIPALLSGLSRLEWGDILELSRRDFYPDDIRQHTLNRVMMQLEMGDPRLLFEVLSKWEPSEMQIFLLELMACLPDTRLDPFASVRSSVHKSIRTGIQPHHLFAEDRSHVH